MRKLAPARVSHWDDFSISYSRVYIMTGSFHILLFDSTFHVDKIHVWFKIANITHALPVPVYRQTNFTPKWKVVSRLHDTVGVLRDFVPEWNSRPGARTGVNSRRGDSRRHNILWWYHVNKYRAMRGNRSELAPGRKSPRCHVNTPYLHMLPFLLVFIVTWYFSKAFCNVTEQSCKFLLSWVTDIYRFGCNAISRFKEWNWTN